MHLICPTNLSTFLVLGETYCWINPTFYPFCTCIFLVESAWRKTRLCCLMYWWPTRALTNTQWYWYICWGQSLSHYPADNFVHFVSPATFSLYCHIFIFIYYVSYSSTNTEAIRIKLPDPNHTFTHLSTSVHLSYLVLWACYYRCTIHILI